MMFIEQALAQTETGAGGGQLYQLLFLAAIFVLFYVLLIRPQRKRQKEHEAMVGALQKADEVITSGGMLGKIIDLDDHFIDVRIARNVEIKMQRAAVLSVLPKGTLKSMNKDMDKDKNKDKDTSAASGS